MVTLAWKLMATTLGCDHSFSLRCDVVAVVIVETWPAGMVQLMCGSAFGHVRRVLEAIAAVHPADRLVGIKCPMVVRMDGSLGNGGKADCCWRAFIFHQN